METAETRQTKSIVLRPVGRLDSVTSVEFQAELLAAVAIPADVVVDFSAVEYISSAGLRALMTAAKLKSPDRHIAVAALNDFVREIFTIARFLHVVTIVARVEDADDAWRATAGAASAPPAARPQGSDAIHCVRFWGSRGSLPAPIGAAAVRDKVAAALLAARGRNFETKEAIFDFIDRELPFAVHATFGGNTSCVEIACGGDEYVLCDLGTGAREFGNRVLTEHGVGKKHCFNVFLSHVHWDHIMGFPFFGPAYIPGNVIRIHGCHSVLQEAMQRQQSDPCFPVDFRSLGATIECVPLEAGKTYEVAGLSVTPIKQFHAGDSYGYRFATDRGAVVYSTDCEHKYKALDETYPFVPFFRDAGVLIFDAMYSLADAISVKEDWGHSSNIAAVELAQLARVKRLVLFHHEPAYNDQMIEAVLRETIRFEEISRADHKVEVIAAYDGLEIEI
ncbi:MAG TPA: MBL fold metallo-hydrolase [Stellaceae bacterium]|nr:MBL fold metallo-hydrolase [Stellaceae bacterium]